MNSVRVLNRSVFAAIFLVTICYGLQDLRCTHKVPILSYSGFVDGREIDSVFPRSISKRHQNGNLGHFRNKVQQQLNDIPQWYKLYESDQKLDLDDEKNTLQEIAQNNNAVGELPYFYNNLIESYDKFADKVQKYSDSDFSKRDDETDKVEKGPLKLSELGTGHGNALSNTHNEELNLYQGLIWSRLLDKLIQKYEKIQKPAAVLVQ